MAAAGPGRVHRGGPQDVRRQVLQEDPPRALRPLTASDARRAWRELTCALDAAELGPSPTPFRVGVGGLFVVFAGSGGLPALEQPVDLVRVWVPPFAHPVLERR